MTKAEQLIVECINDNPCITIENLAALSQLSVGYVRKIIATLKNKRILERQGGRKAGRWAVVEASANGA